MRIYPTTFTMEHIPKTLSPAGNISSAPRDFAVYVSDYWHPGGSLLLSTLRDVSFIQRHNFVVNVCSLPVKPFPITKSFIFSLI